MSGCQQDHTILSTGLLCVLRPGLRSHTVFSIKSLFGEGEVLGLELGAWSMQTVCSAIELRPSLCSGYAVARQGCRGQGSLGVTLQAT
jgi:hypothetical protein